MLNAPNNGIMIHTTTIQKPATIICRTFWFIFLKNNSSRLIDVNQTMHIVPPGSTGARRAVLIGINYTGQQGELRGCHNDVKNIKEYLIRSQGFKESDMLILMDDGKHHAPTRRNIEQAFVRETQYSKAGDCLFVHYSGHGGRVRDLSGK